jgi:hypothetical protein
MSIIDLLFNTGPQAKETILKGGTMNASNLDNSALSKTLIIEPIKKATNKFRILLFGREVCPLFSKPLQDAHNPSL